MENDYLNGDVPPLILWNFSELKYEHKRVHFSPYDFFLYDFDIHMVHEREKCTPLRSYISRAVNVGAELKTQF